MFAIARSNFVIDATIRGGIARFINHSCDPNAVSKLVSIEGSPKIIIFAHRKIHVGEVCLVVLLSVVVDDRASCSAFRLILSFVACINSQQEITYDYMFALDDADKVPCSCGAANCKGWMN